MIHSQSTLSFLFLSLLKWRYPVHTKFFFFRPVAQPSEIIVAVLTADYLITCRHIIINQKHTSSAALTYRVLKLHYSTNNNQKEFFLYFDTSNEVIYFNFSTNFVFSDDQVLCVGFMDFKNWSLNKRIHSKISKSRTTASSCHQCQPAGFMIHTGNRVVQCSSVCPTGYYLQRLTGSCWYRPLFMQSNLRMLLMSVFTALLLYYVSAVKLSHRKLPFHQFLVLFTVLLP